MKQSLTAIAVISILALAATFAFAHGPRGWRDGNMMGREYCDERIMTHDCGGKMMGAMNGMHKPMNDQQFLNETKELRKELHGKKFEYREALHNPKTTDDTLAVLEKDIRELRGRIAEKAPDYAGSHGRYDCNK
ncbi:MAG: hypothetical protein HY808_10870 [Nitrospirae bacterium]|nr:hypothetical protein [Nitrospirota bacterium]